MGMGDVFWEERTEGRKGGAAEYKGSPGIVFGQVMGVEEEKQIVPSGSGTFEIEKSVSYIRPWVLEEPEDAIVRRIRRKVPLTHGRHSKNLLPRC